MQLQRPRTLRDLHHLPRPHTVGPLGADPQRKCHCNSDHHHDPAAGTLRAVAVHTISRSDRRIDITTAGRNNMQRAAGREGGGVGPAEDRTLDTAAEDTSMVAAAALTLHIATAAEPTTTESTSTSTSRRPLSRVVAALSTATPNAAATVGDAVILEAATVATAGMDGMDIAVAMSAAIDRGTITMTLRLLLSTTTSGRGIPITREEVGARSMALMHLHGIRTLQFGDFVFSQKKRV